MSYRKKHIKNKIKKIRPRKSALKRPWFWVLFLILIIISAITYSLFFYSGFQVKNIVVSGNEKTKTEDLEKLIYKNINAGLIKKSIFLVNSDDLSKEILEKFPIIERIKIKRVFPQTLILGIEERKPIGVYCSEQCFLIDANGIIFEPLQMPPVSMFVVRQASETEQIFVGEKIIAENIISAISKIQKSLKDNFEIDLIEALITSPVRLDIKTSENWQIYFNSDSDSDIDFQITKLNLLLNSEIKPEDRKNLRYINLIPKDRAIICDNKTCGD